MSDSPNVKRNETGFLRQGDSFRPVSAGDPRFPSHMIEEGLEREGYDKGREVPVFTHLP